MVIALGLAGRLTFNPMNDAISQDGKELSLTPPKKAPDLPQSGFIRDTSGYVEPPASGAGIEVKVAAGSERLELLEPFAAWDGQDFVELPVLLKAKGKCTTDHISPAGPWLRYRGHLDRISDNMFLGAVNAFTGETGHGRDPASGATGVPFTKIARGIKESGSRWIAVGDENYGEGSSREHAAMSPRFLGAVAVIVRSFARIHESNLKKQGILPLTFLDPADYEKVRDGDRISLTGLDRLAPGRGVEATIHHEDGSTESMKLLHTLNEEQIGWFKAGGALNKLRGK
jgi:aconitate hydratase